MLPTTWVYKISIKMAYSHLSACADSYYFDSILASAVQRRAANLRIQQTLQTAGALGALLHCRGQQARLGGHQSKGIAGAGDAGVEQLTTEHRASVGQGSPGEGYPHDDGHDGAQGRTETLGNYAETFPLPNGGYMPTEQAMATANEQNRIAKRNMRSL